ncbi:MAG: hypothetical protein QM765_34880 [Myxococcales bacterium]
MTLQIGPESFTATETGFQWQTAGGAVHEGSWSRVSSVTAMTATNRVEGVDLLVQQHLAVTLDVGETFKVETRDAEATHLAKQVLAYAAPHITERLLAKLDEGKIVDFGAVALSPQRIAVYGKSWALSEVAGHRTAHGYWMLDVGPKQEPRLAATVKLCDLPNHFALVAGLEKVLPGSEYAEDCDWLGTALRPSATSQDPRQMTTRAKVMALAGAGAAVVAVLAIVLAGLGLSHYLEQRRVEDARQKTAARVEKAARIARALSIPEAPIACEKLPKDVDRTIFVLEPKTGLEHPLAGAPYTLSPTGVQALSPFDTSTHLAFARVVSFGKLEGATYFELHAAMALLELDSGQVQCTGQLAVRISGSQHPEARLAEGLAFGVCPASGAGPSCQGALPGVKVIPPPPPLPKEEPVVKEAPKPEPPKWARGLKVEVQRKKEWLPATITAVSKRGIRVRYDKAVKPREELVQPVRLRPR